MSRRKSHEKLRGLEPPEIPVGWLPWRWRQELLRKAAICESAQPKLAEHYKGWAEQLPEDHGDIEQLTEAQRKAMRE